MIWTIVLVVISLVWFYIYIYRGKTQEDGINGKPIPGPKGLPLVGSAFDIQPETIHLKFTELAKTYGNIFQLKIFSNTTVILNDEHLIRKAFSSEEFKPYFSDRMGSFFGYYFRAKHRSVAFVDNGTSPFQKVAKKAYIQALHVYGSGKQRLESTVNKELANLVAKFERFDGAPFDANQVIQRSLSNVLSVALTGELLTTEDLESDMFWNYVDSALQLLNVLYTLVLNTCYLVGFLPGKIGQAVRRVKETSAILDKKLFEDVKKTHVPGSPRGIVDWYLDEQARQKAAGSDIVFTDKQIIAQIEETILAGLATSASAMTSTILILINHPEIQIKLREEFNRVIGQDREPSVTDREKCLYFKAFEYEVHRYVPVVPITLDRYCRQHVVFEGYDIKPNTVLHGNIWKLHHDENVWGDPWVFRPERFLDDDGQLLPKEHTLMKNFLAFGTGQRLCPGELFAKVRYFLYLSTLLRRWTFTFPEGQSMSCDPRDTKAFESSITFATKPYMCCAKPIDKM